MAVGREFASRLGLRFGAPAIRFRARRRPPLIPVVIVGLTLIAAVFADFLMPHDPIKSELSKRLIPPAFAGDGTLEHLLGTDQQGRDILSRLILGARFSVIVSVVAIALGGVVGTFLGLLSAYAGGKVDAVIMRIADAFLAFPMILLALLFAVLLEPSLLTVVLVLGLVLWARFARLIRGEALSLKQRDFIALAKVSGASTTWIIARHLLPNVMNTLIVMATLLVAWAILAEASLSFLGAGVPRPNPSWGSMIADGRRHLETAWWVSTIPGIAIALVVLATNLFGDWLRDTLDPTLRQT